MKTNIREIALDNIIRLGKALNKGSITGETFRLLCDKELAIINSLLVR